MTCRNITKKSIDLPLPNRCNVTIENRSNLLKNNFVQLFYPKDATNTKNIVSLFSRFNFLYSIIKLQSKQCIKKKKNFMALFMEGVQQPQG